MTTERDPRTSIVLSWLREDAHEDAERLLLRTLDEVDTTPQRGPWRPAWRNSDMNSYAKLAIAIAAVVVIAVAGFQLLPGTNGPGGQPTQSASPPASPTASAMSMSSGVLAPGRYAWTGSGPDITFQIPAGWTGVDSAIEKGEIGWGLSQRDSDWVNHVFADACQTAGGLEPFDLTVQGLVDALAAQVGTDETVTDVTIAGRTAKRVDLVQAAGLDRATCTDGADGPLKIWANPGPPVSDYFALGPGYTGSVHALDVNGELVIFAGSIGPDVPASDVAELESIVDSIQIGP